MPVHISGSSSEGVAAAPDMNSAAARTNAVFFAIQHFLVPSKSLQINYNRSTDKINVYVYLPTDDYAIEDVYTPDVWDCQHDFDLIASVQYVLHYRNADIVGLEAAAQGNESAVDH